MSRVEDRDDAKRRADLRVAEQRAIKQKAEKRAADATAFDKRMERIAGDEAGAKARQVRNAKLAASPRHDTVPEFERERTMPDFEPPSFDESASSKESPAKAAMRAAKNAMAGEAEAEAGVPETGAQRDPPAFDPTRRRDSTTDAKARDARADAKANAKSSQPGRVGRAGGEREEKKGDQHGQEGGKPQDGSFKLPPAALMAPPPVAQPKESSAAGRMRALAQEIIDKIVQRVRVGANAEGLPEFQIELRSSILAGLFIRVASNRGRIRAVFTSRDRAVLRALKGGAKALEEALSSRGIPVEELAFEES